MSGCDESSDGRCAPFGFVYVKTSLNSIFYSSKTSNKQDSSLFLPSILRAANSFIKSCSQRLVSSYPHHTIHTASLVLAGPSTFDIGLQSGLIHPPLQLLPRCKYLVTTLLRGQVDI
jgi:hypothetical protein